MLQLVLQHEARKKAQSISKQSNQFRQEHDTQDETNQTASSTIQAKESNETLKMKELNN